jgi:hypothetical protein
MDTESIMKHNQLKKDLETLIDKANKRTKRLKQLFHIKLLKFKHESKTRKVIFGSLNNGR